MTQSTSGHWSCTGCAHHLCQFVVDLARAEQKTLHLLRVSLSVTVSDHSLEGCPCTTTPMCSLPLHLPSPPLPSPPLPYPTLPYNIHYKPSVMSVSFDFASGCLSRLLGVINTSCSEDRGRRRQGQRGEGRGGDGAWMYQPMTTTSSLLAPPFLNLAPPTHRLPEGHH